MYVDPCELILLGFGLGRELVPLSIEIGALGVGLRAHRHVFAGCHGEGAGDESGYAGEQHVVSRRIRGGDADDETGRRHDAIVGPEDRRAQPANPLTSMTLAMCHATHSL